MSDRRRAPRYQLRRTTKAEINLLHDVVIQSAIDDDVVVLTSTYPAHCDRLLVQFAGADNQVTSLEAQVIGTAPVVHEGLVQFRVALRVTGFSELARVNPLARLG